MHDRHYLFMIFLYLLSSGCSMRCGLAARVKTLKITKHEGIKNIVRMKDIVLLCVLITYCIFILNKRKKNKI